MILVGPSSSSSWLIKDAGDVGVLQRGEGARFVSVGWLDSRSCIGSSTVLTPFPSVGLSVVSNSSLFARRSGPLDNAESRKDGGCGLQRPSLAVVKVLVVMSLLADDRKEL